MRCDLEEVHLPPYGPGDFKMREVADQEPYCHVCPLVAMTSQDVRDDDGPFRWRNGWSGWRGREDEANAARDNPVPPRNPHVSLDRELLEMALANREDPSRFIDHELDGRGMRDEDYEAWHIGHGILQGMRTPAILFHINPYCRNRRSVCGGWGGSSRYVGHWIIESVVAAYPDDLLGHRYNPA
jgi:hypothetical protein